MKTAIRASVLALLGAAALGSAGAARAQVPASDPRWQAFLGCWELQAGVRPDTAGAARPVVCVVPGEDAASVEVVSISGGQVVSRETVVASGERRVVARDGCTGWEQATWSLPGDRVYLRAQYGCGVGVERRASGLMAMTANGEWLDVQALTVKDRVGMRVLRYRPAGPGVVLADEIAAAVGPPTLAVQTARLAAGAPLTTADVVDASRHVDSAVVQAWLVERGQGFELTGRRLVELADAGVPGAVTDVMVALSHPRVFQVNPASREPERAPDVGGELKPELPRYGYAARGGVYGGRYSPYGWDAFEDPYYWRYGMYSPYGWNAYSPWGYGYGYGPYGYGYGYGSYGYGYGYGYGGWYWGNGPVVIVTGENGVAPPSQGRVVNGRGYTRPSSGTGTGTGSGERREARPRDSSSGSVVSGGGSSGGSSSGGSARPSSGGSSGSSGSSSSGSSTGRTAQPRPPNR